MEAAAIEKDSCAASISIVLGLYDYYESVRPSHALVGGVRGASLKFVES